MYHNEKKNPKFNTSTNMLTLSMEKLAVFLQSIEKHRSKTNEIDDNNNTTTTTTRSTKQTCSSTTHEMNIDLQCEIDMFYHMWCGHIDEQYFSIHKTLQKSIYHLLQEIIVRTADTVIIPSNKTATKHYKTLLQNKLDGYIDEMEWSLIIRVLFEDVEIQHISEENVSEDVYATTGLALGTRRDSPKSSQKHADTIKKHKNDMFQKHSDNRIANSAAVHSHSNVATLYSIIEDFVDNEQATKLGAKRLTTIPKKHMTMGRSTYHKIGYNVHDIEVKDVMRSFASEYNTNNVKNLGEMHCAARTLGSTGLNEKRVQSILDDSGIYNINDDNTNKASSSSSVGAKKYRIPTRRFIKLLLDYQLNLHITYLKPFSDAFQKIDTNSDGACNRTEFCELFMKYITHENYHIVPPLIAENIYSKNRLGNVVLVSTKGSIDEDKANRILNDIFKDIDPLKMNFLTFSQSAGAIYRMSSY